jgi:HEPN domain-containing protein
VKKAEEDWTGIVRLRASGLEEVADIVAFLAQQCAEKYLKALIQKDNTEPPRLHHLPALLGFLLPVYPGLEVLRISCERLTPYAVGFRYPGEEASPEDAKEAIDLAQEIRHVIRHTLNLESRTSRDTPEGNRSRNEDL